MKPAVIIYRDQLIPYSETFIPAQVENFSSYQGFYVGSSRFPTAQSMLPQERTIVLGDLASPPGFWKTTYKLTGFVHPRWLKPLQDLSPRLIHAHFGLDGVFALPLARTLKLPLLVTFHGYFATAEIELNQSKSFYAKTRDFVNNRGQFYRELYFRNRDRLFQQADGFIAVSEFIRSQLIEKGCPPEKVQVNYIGIDLDKFTPNPEFKREPIVLFVGRFVEKKGCEYVIRAMAEVQRIRPDVELVLIGDGVLRESLEDLAQKLLKRYRFLGVQPSEMVKNWMQKASVLAAPSLTTSQGESEGLPMTILEAMAMKLSVVSSEHAGIPEAIVHGKNGFLIAEKDTHALTKYLLELLNNPLLQEQFTEKGRQELERKFNQKQNIVQLERIYGQLALS